MEPQKATTRTTRTQRTKRLIAPLFDGSAYLTSKEDMVALFDEALSDGDPRIIAAALGDIAKALGMTRLAQETGVRREALYRALSPDGNPELCTFLKVTNALGLELHATLPDSRPNPSKIPLSSLDVSPNPVPGIAKVAARKATVPKTLPPGKVVKVSSKAVPARKVSK